LIPESPFYLEGGGGLFEFVEERLKENGHMVIVLAEGAGQDYVSQDSHPADEKDASGNRLLLDVGLWLSHKIKVQLKLLRSCLPCVFFYLHLRLYA
jgi:6-phosphofructokinase 1